MKKFLLSAVAFLIMCAAHAQWLNQNAGFTNDTLGFYEMSLPNKNTAWAICYDGRPGTGLGVGRFVLDFTRTTNGGKTWKPGKMGNDHTLQFSNISAIDEKEAWVAMNKRFVTGGGLYHTTDGGVNWKQEGVGEIFDENSFPNFVYFKDKNHGIAMGDPNGGYFEIYITNNKGKKWKRVSQNDLPAVLPNEYGWISGYAAVGNTIWFGTTAGRVFKSKDFGKSWSAYTADPGGKFVMEIAFSDDMLHGVAHLRNSNQTFLYTTSDGGKTWTNRGQPAGWKSSRITAVPGTTSFVATSVNGFDFGSSVSHDYGTTWTIIESTVPKAVCRFFDANTGYAGGFFSTGPPFRGGIYKSQLDFETCNRHENMLTQKGAAGGNSVADKENSVAGDLVKVYPSPASNVINIELGAQLLDEDKTIELISPDGRVVETRRSEGSKFIQFDVSRLTPGFYVVRMKIRNNVITRSVIISR